MSKTGAHAISLVAVALPVAALTHALLPGASRAAMRVALEGGDVLIPSGGLMRRCVDTRSDMHLALAILQ